MKHDKTFNIIKKTGKILGIIILVLTMILLCLYLIFNEKLPQGKQSPEADALAYKMLEAIDHEAYTSTRFLEWTFRGQNHYTWDKQQQLVDVSWNKNLVQLNIQHPEKSAVTVNNVIIEGAAKLKLIEKAVAYFNNDSFWLVAPQKVFDPGTERRIVLMDDGTEALLVTYTSGGNTPGDSYLWFLDKSGLPTAFKMWVSIIPLGGVEATWEGWKSSESGTLLPAYHKLGFLTLDMGAVKAWN